MKTLARNRLKIAMQKINSYVKDDENEDFKNTTTNLEKM